MRFKDLDKFVHNSASVDGWKRASFDLLRQNMEDIQMNGIISLCLSSNLSAPKRHTNVFLTQMLSKSLPNLHEIDFPNADVCNYILGKFSRNFGKSNIT